MMYDENSETFQLSKVTNTPSESASLVVLNWEFYVAWVTLPQTLTFHSKDILHFILSTMHFLY